MNIPALLPLKSKLVSTAALISGLFGFTFTEMFTNQYVLATLSAVVASIFGALFVAIPRIMGARTDARDLDAKINAELWEKATSFNQDVINFFKNRLAAKELTVMLEHRSKNKIYAECQRQLAHIYILEGLLRTESIVSPEFRPKSYEELVGEEDRIIEAQVLTRIEEAAITMPVPPTTASVAPPRK